MFLQFCAVFLAAVAGLELDMPEWVRDRSVVGKAVDPNGGVTVYQATKQEGLDDMRAGVENMLHGSVVRKVRKVNAPTGGFTSPCVDDDAEVFRLSERSTCRIHDTQSGKANDGPGASDTVLKEDQVCRSECCRKCAVKPGRGFSAFARRLVPGSAARICGMGDSVAYQHDFSTPNTFLETLKQHLPDVNWTMNPKRTAALPSSVLDSMAMKQLSFDDCDVIFIQYHQFANHEPLTTISGSGTEHVRAMTGADGTYYRNFDSESLLRTLLNLPTKPWIVLIGHCHRLPEFRGGVPESAAVLQLDGSSHVTEVLGADLMRKERDAMNELARHYGVTFLNTCGALETLRSGACSGNGDRAYGNSTNTLGDDLFQENDVIHYIAKGAGMQGCLIADLVLSAMHAPEAAATVDSAGAPLPSPLHPESMDNMRAVFLFSANNQESLDPGSGWMLQVGGHRKDKRWYSPTVVGANMTQTTPPCTRIELEFYRHPVEAMGAVEVFVDGNKTAYLDACCPAGGCNGVPQGQGFNYREKVADQLSMKSHEVIIRTVRRKTKTTCEKDGNQFSLVAIIGKTPAP